MAIGWSRFQKFPDYRKTSEEQRDLFPECLELDFNPHFQFAESFLNISSLYEGYLKTGDHWGILEKNHTTVSWFKMHRLLKIALEQMETFSSR